MEQRSAKKTIKRKAIDTLLKVTVKGRKKPRLVGGGALPLVGNHLGKPQKKGGAVVAMAVGSH